MLQLLLGEEDLKAGGDAKELINHTSEELSEGRINSENLLSPLGKEKKSNREEFAEKVFQDLASSRAESEKMDQMGISRLDKSKDEETMEKAMEEAIEESNTDGIKLDKSVTPRTKLKNDLKKLADEITADFEDSEMETADEVDTPILSKPALVKLEKSIKAFLDKDEMLESGENTQISEEDLLTSLKHDSANLETKISKIICQEGKPCTMMQSVPVLEGLSALKTPSLPSIESDAKSVPVSFVLLCFFFKDITIIMRSRTIFLLLLEINYFQEVMLSLTGRLSESYSMQEKLAAENADLEGVR